MPRKSRTAALRIILAAMLAAAPAAAQWEELGPAPIDSNQFTGRIAALAAHPTDANLYYAGAADGGVWRTLDGGASWQPLTDGLPTVAIGALALAPSDPNILYAGSGEANFANHSRYGLGFYRSVDGGESWQVLAADGFAGRCFSALVVDPRSADIVYAAVTRAGGFPALSAAKGHPQADGPVGVFRSLDGGRSWEHLTTGLPALCATSLAMNPQNPGELTAGIGHIFGDAANGIYRSTDGGASWFKLTAGLPATLIGRVSVAIAPSQPLRLYAMLTQPASATGADASMEGAYRSDNGGATWTKLTLSNIQATYGWYLSVISVDPANADRAFFGGLNLARTSNAGATWQTVTPPHVDLHALAWDAAGRLLSGDDGGVHRTANLGGLWEARNDGLGSVQFYAGISSHPTDAAFVIGGAQDNGTNRRDAQGWTHVVGGDGGWTQIDQSNPLRLFAEYQGSSNVFRSINGGQTFSFSGSGIISSDRNCFLPPYLINPADSNQMLFATHRIYRSVNGGSNWSVLSADLTGGAPAAIRSLAQAHSDPNVVYAATNDARVLRSDDGGATFTLLPVSTSAWPRVTRELAVSDADPLEVYLATGLFGAAQVRRSLDGGQTWETLDGDLPDVPVNTLALDERAVPTVLYAGADDGVYRSIDGGASWTRFGATLPRGPVIDLRAEPQHGRLLAATQGRGLWSIALLIPGDADGDCLVGQLDLNLMLAAFGTSAGEAGYNHAADFDGDGFIGQLDLNVLLSRYGSTCP